MRHRNILFAACALASALPSARAQSYKQDIGDTRLLTEQGSFAPTAAGVPVTQVEADLAPPNNYYFPILTQPDGSSLNPDFTGKNIHATTQPANGSSHATTVAQYFYGNDSSIAPGITSINVFNADDWVGDQFLNTGDGSLLPDVTTDRVANHSYIGIITNMDGSNDYPDTLDALHRMDYVVQHDDYINVIACNNPGGAQQPLFADSFNVITVGLTNGNAASETVDVEDPQGLYVAGRAAPDVVAPMGATSFATPIVSATAALLVGYADSQPGPTFVSPRTGLTLKYGESADVIKAAIMAGADRVTSNTSTSDQVSDYRAVGYQTQNGLDTRYGAGQVDVYNSYHIIAGGLQGPGNIGTFGYDYEPNFKSARPQDYTFTGQYGVAATLAWNVHIDDNMNATLAHFQLSLYDITGGETPVLIASSVSAIDNTQNIYFNGLPASDTFELEVLRTDDINASWDYALAWDLAPAPEPGSGLLLLVGMVAMSRRRRRDCPRMGTNLRE